MECIDCPDGYIASEDQSECYPCVAGSQPNAEKHGCEACADGWYNPFMGSTCKKCPEMTESTDDRM